MSEVATAPQPGPINWNSTSCSAQNSDAMAPTMTQADANSIMMRNVSLRPTGLISWTASLAVRVNSNSRQSMVFPQGSAPRDAAPGSLKPARTSCSIAARTCSSREAGTNLCQTTNYLLSVTAPSAKMRRERCGAKGMAGDGHGRA